MPMDEKPGYADDVVRNEGSLQEPRRQVEALWHALGSLHRDRAGRTGPRA